MTLLIEDDAATAGFLIASLHEEGCRVVHAADGPAGAARAREGQFDVLIVDRMLPGIDGLSLVRSLRENGVPTPTLFLTTMAGIDDRVDGLERNPFSLHRSLLLRSSLRIRLA